MFLYCYARSGKAKSTGGKLLKEAEGEWIEDMESFVLGLGTNNRRADGTVVLIMPQELCVKILVERIYPSDIKYPVINITPDGKYAGILRAAGYNTYQILARISSILGSICLSGEDDLKDAAPDLMHTVNTYQMKPDNEQLLSEIAGHIRNGGSVDIYSDLPLEMSEPVLDSLSYKTFLFQSNQKNELDQAYSAACEEDRYAIFITFGLISGRRSGTKVLILVPKIVVAGIEIAGRADPDYSAKTVRDALTSHGINPDSVVTLAASALAKESEVVKAVAEDLGCFVTFFDSRLLKAVRVPLTGGFTTDKIGADFCTAAACLASDNGKILVRRTGDRNSALITASIKRSPVLLTE